ncbi:MAG: hypothetical protein ACRD4Y_00580, partial [Candidatus Acidiferrales bacterium]
MTKLLNEFENCEMNRRQLMRGLGLTAVAAFAASALPNCATAFAAGAPQKLAFDGKVAPTTTVH